MCVTEFNQPSAVKTDEDPDADVPYHVWNTADGEKEKSKYNYRNPMIVLQPYIKGIFDQIWRVFKHHPGIPFLTYSARLDPAILGLPHCILYLLNDIVELDSS
jgi:hypothetical protein